MTATFQTTYETLVLDWRVEPIGPERLMATAEKAGFTVWANDIDALKAQAARSAASAFNLLQRKGNLRRYVEQRQIAQVEVKS